MRFLFLLILIANITVFALGQGLFGPAPDKVGRQAASPKQINAENVKILGSRSVS